MRFEGKTCVVTGGANGIGRCIAEAFVHEGAHVAVIDTDASTGERLTQKLGEKLLFVQGDVGDKHTLCISLSGRVRVNALSPGWIDTGAYQQTEGYAPHLKEDQLQHPSGRMGQPSDIAAMTLYLCSAEAGFIDGENITIDGGMTRRMIYHGDDGWHYKINV